MGPAARREAYPRRRRPVVAERRRHNYAPGVGRGEHVYGPPEPSGCDSPQLDDATLPSDGPPGTINAGHGSGKTCDACSDPIEPTQVEYEMNYPQERRTFRFHLGCAGLWEAGRLKGGLDPAL
jgi:hypothetical protein